MRLKALLICAALLCAGCESYAYKQTIQQGNIIDVDTLEQIQIGDSQEKVLSLMGAPLVRDPFHPSQWDYIYTKKSMEDKYRNRQHVVFYFEDQRVVKIGRD